MSPGSCLLGSLVLTREVFPMSDGPVHIYLQALIRSTAGKNGTKESSIRKKNGHWVTQVWMILWVEKTDNTVEQFSAHQLSQSGNRHCIHQNAPCWSCLLLPASLPSLLWKQRTSSCKFRMVLSRKKTTHDRGFGFNNFILVVWCVCTIKQHLPLRQNLTSTEFGLKRRTHSSLDFLLTKKQFGIFVGQRQIQTTTCQMWAVTTLVVTMLVSSSLPLLQVN